MYEMFPFEIFTLKIVSRFCELFVFRLIRVLHHKYQRLFGRSHYWTRQPNYDPTNTLNFYTFKLNDDFGARKKPRIYGRASSNQALP